MLLNKAISELKLHLKVLRSTYIGHKFKKCGSNVLFERYNLICGHQYISIGRCSDFQVGLYLTAWDKYQQQCFQPEINIGNHCHVGAYNHISCINKIVIGDGFVSGKWVTITDNAHGTSSFNDMAKEVALRSLYTKGQINIGKNVWVGDKATILSGVTIGDGVIIGANSVVTKNVPAYCVVGGNPAIILKQCNNI